jgi:hypothetical protein
VTKALIMNRMSSLFVVCSWRAWRGRWLVATGCVWPLVAVAVRGGGACGTLTLQTSALRGAFNLAAQWRGIGCCAPASALD